MGNRDKGFTLIEMLVVIGVLLVLLSIAAPMMSAFTERARAVSCLATRYNTERAEIAYMLGKNVPSPDSAALIASGFLSREPQCPSGGTYVWLQRTPVPILGCSIHYAAVPGGEAADILFTTSFNGMAGMKRLSGKWHLFNGTLTNIPGQENRIAFGETDWTNYEIKVTAVLTQGNGYGIYYRSDGNPNISGYVFQYDPGLGNRFVVRKVVGGAEQSPFQSVSMPAGFPIYNQAHDISISVVGNSHVIKVDSQVVLSFTDDRFASGFGGFRTWGNTVVGFDNLSVAKR